MSWTLGSTPKVCANCEFWSGARELVSMRTRVTVNHSTDKGRCLGRTHNKVQKSAATSACRDYQKWAVMK